MGEIFRGIDPQLALGLKRSYNLPNFVETGTLMGKTALWASEHFHNVWTIEAYSKHYSQAQRRLQTRPNVQILLGASQDLLGGVLASMEGSALIWLDAHWSRDLGYDAPETICPVLAEIEHIRNNLNGHIVMVDDARLFGAAPGWPTLKTVREALTFGGDRSTIVINDIIVSTP